MLGWLLGSTGTRDDLGLPSIEVARSWRWPALRDRHLGAFPSCEACGGRREAAVHHALPVHLFPELELDPNNLITLCERPARNCHLIFGHLLRWDAYNPNVRANTAEYLMRVAGRKLTR